MTDVASVTTVTIPVPQDFPRSYGVHSVTHSSGGRLIQRYSRNEVELIEAQAKRLGVTTAMFIRQCAMNVAQALAKQEKEKDSVQHDNRSG